MSWKFDTVRTLWIKKREAVTATLSIHNKDKSFGGFTWRLEVMLPESNTIKEWKACSTLDQYVEKHKAAPTKNLYLKEIRCAQNKADLLIEGILG